MERRGLNIRKSFLRAVLPMIRALPLPVASRFVSGIGRMEYRWSKSLRTSFRRRRLPRPIRARLRLGRPLGEPRTGRQPRLVANTRPAFGRRSRPACPRDVHGDRPRKPRRRVRAGSRLYRAGQPLRCASLARSLAVSRVVPRSLLHGTSPPHFPLPGSAFRYGRSARPGQALHLAAGSAGRFSQLDPPGSPSHQGRHASLSWPATSAGPDNSPSLLIFWAAPCDSRRPGSFWRQ